MADQNPPARPIEPQEIVVASVTVTDRTPMPGGRLRDRVTGNPGCHGPRAALAVALVCAAVGAVIAFALPADTTSRPAVPRARVPERERTAIGAVLGYPYPLRCLTITIADGEPDYARVNVNRTNGCGHFHGYINASLHRVGGVWRLVLDEGQLFVPNSLLAPRHSG